MPNPYEDPKTGTPLNRLGIDDKETLHLRESMAVAKRLLQLRQKPIEGDFGPAHLQAIHKHLLQDVYDWAGKFRTVPMRNSRSRVSFAEPDEIVPKLQAIGDRLKTENLLAGLSKDQLSMKAAQLLRDINAVHAFPDGNGRTQREILRTLGVQAGYKIDWNYQTENQIYQIYQIYQFNKASRIAHNDGNLIGLAHIMRDSTTERPPDRQASHKVRDERKLTVAPRTAGLSAVAAGNQDNAARERAEHDLKLLLPYLPGGRIPENAKTHCNLRFWQVKDGEQVTKYAVGVLSHPDLAKPGRDQKAQSAMSRGTGFDAGHLIGHQFGGPEIAANLSLQNPTMNQGGGNWYKMESQWAQDLRNDNRVAVVVKEVTRPDNPNFLWRSVDSLTINMDGKVRHDEVSMLNPETERAVAAQGRIPVPEVPGGAVIHDLRPTLAAHEEVEQKARQAAQERLEAPQTPQQSSPSGYKRVLSQLQSWRGHSKDIETKEPESIGSLGPGPEGKTLKEADSEREANERLQKMLKDHGIPQLDKMTWVAHPRTGDVTYSLSGKAAFVDRGKAITVLQPEAAATRIALGMAVQKYGRSIDATGTPAFQKQIIQAALSMRADIVFTDPKIQARFIAARGGMQKQESKTKAEEAQRHPENTLSKLASDRQATQAVKVSERDSLTVPDPERTFTKHAHALRQRYGFGLDAEKADSIVALKMAQAGWKPEDIASALKTRRLNLDLSEPNEIDAYAKKLTLQAVGRAAREATVDRSTSMGIGR